ncbi:MAG: hypothetical protein ACR2FU_16115 [Streptosporangiaceae bacterium]
MRWGWLLPDPSHQALYEGWERQPYRPRHGRPPFVIRGAYSAAVALARARGRYLGAIDEDYAVAAGAQVTDGVRAVAGVSATVGAATGGRPRSAE